MKKVLSLMIFPFLLWGTAGVKAQVTIGSDVVPQSGAVLDLSRVNSRDLGLLLPRVWLEDITKWQLRSNPGDSEEERVGMIVYNTNTNVSYGEGLYIWTGKEGGWEPLRRSCVSKPAVPTGIEFSKMGIRLNETITATAIPEVTSG
ncbi:MAG: hypothetical protein LBC48_04585, partial [Dysgonamonadaceae bacterium]|nr:hypothetical protein [Dysgonamonadaceae bacterium]